MVQLEGRDEEGVERRRCHVGPGKVSGGLGGLTGHLGYLGSTRPDAVMSAPQPVQLELTQAPAGPEKPPGSTPCSGDTFKISIVTSDKYAAGTGATVRLSFTDTGGQVRPIRPLTLISPASLPEPLQPA